ncbi:type IV pilus modification PilV family protein [Vibrio methylphosphonaticus]|uniref:type IV pilus modification PilV family protein n=1 Tax=Vibrio methylphosphonaticus TaxID=2946866 RepID=UPI00202A0583|nr:prepilin-type N-terminal cleavage/methylation domain-containing protein [Vibrio methylphosphonaticus]MCL9776010.1 prepilin-type N-terminal cleavage/methylation domain-containing protein [Vibrio methylphosphonaticus]
MISKQQGFSLIEVMIAFCLIGVGALGLVKMQTYIEQKSDYAAQSIQALGLAEARLEWFSTRGADASLSTMNIADFVTDLVDGEDLTHSPFLVEWTVSAVPFSSSIKTVEVVVSWPDRFGQTQTLSLQTQFSNYSEFD